MLAPAVQIDNEIYGFVQPQTVGKVLSDFLESQQKKKSSTLSCTKVSDKAAEVRICLCSSCIASGSYTIYEEAQKQIHSLGLDAIVKSVGCMGNSYRAPSMEIAMEEKSHFYGNIKPDMVRSLLTQNLPVRGMLKRIYCACYGLLEKIYTQESWQTLEKNSYSKTTGEDLSYFSGQQYIALENCGQSDPLNFEDYARHGGWKAIAQCLAEKNPQKILQQIQESGLRGRGGGGFPTGLKWANVIKSPESEKYLVCNGDEGDPGAFMDRMILESYPFRVIEGMIVASYCIGAKQGFLYIRHEYPLAVKRMLHALEICREKKLLGENILGSHHSFDLKVVEGAGAFVCGEETALIASLEGKSGMPHYRPPYPSEKGFRNKPTLVNNVETFAMIPWILRQENNAFAQIGTQGSKGTKTFALAGKVLRGGLVEVPMGITLREIVEKIGGGVAKGTCKAIQIGGPSGGCIPYSLADTPVDYESLVSHGAIMGSGGMVVLDDSDCMVEISRYFLSFTQSESCGKCTYCRVGTKKMLLILERLTQGKAKEEEIQEMESLGQSIREGSLCGLGKTAPNPVLSSLRHFKEEFLAHTRGICPAKKCKSLIQYSVTDRCIGCTKCSQNCPFQAIAFTPYQKAYIENTKCTRCDVCKSICPINAIEILPLQTI
ncbi:MAG: 4Fe-4S dicluster domain-containing protein [Candidatus Brocadiae bacterium]|nr:4Fe-4S dicluster domain-containing protein [Candidatus Brocadiia bacterium]